MNDPVWMGVTAACAFVSAVCCVVIALTAADINHTLKRIKEQASPPKPVACKLT